MAALAIAQKLLHGCTSPHGHWEKNMQRLHPRLFHLCIRIAASCLPGCRALHLHLCICALYFAFLHVLHCICFSASLHLSYPCFCTAPAFCIAHLSVLHCICHLCICISATLHLASQGVLHLVLHGQSMAQHSVHVLFGLAWVGTASWACS